MRQTFFFLESKIDWIVSLDQISATITLTDMS